MVKRLSIDNIFRSQPATVTVGMISGETKTGILNGFYQTAELILGITVKNSCGEMEQMKMSFLSKDISYVAFHKSETPVNWTEHVEMREFDIHLPGGKKFTVETDPKQLSHPIGFYSIPSSKFSLYSEIFFYSNGINRHEDKEPLGSIMVRTGVLKADVLEKGLSEQVANRNAPIGQILVEQQKINSHDIDKAAEQQVMQQRRGKPLRLGEVLVEAGLATEEDISSALKEQKNRKGKRLGEVLVDLGIVKEEDVSKTLANKFHLPFVNLDEVEINPEAMNEIPLGMIRRYRVFPYQSDEHSIGIAIADPLSMESIDMLRFNINKRLNEAVVMPSQLESYIHTYLDEDDGSEEHHDDMDNILNQLKTDAADDWVRDSQAVDFITAEKDDTAVAKLVNRIILDAFRRGASDIHIEPYGKSEATTVRFRVDGACRIYQQIPAAYRSRLVSRIKIMANIDITERRKPQDGKIRFRAGNKTIELRVATLPTVEQNEDVVLRILAGGEPIPLTKMNLSDTNMRCLKIVISRPYGLILVVGPTGSGKTTTLHSMMGEINVEERKIWTAEDPVEITQHGLRQVQVNPKIDFTFAAAMRSFLRADPDVIMVGEMRDTETATIGIEASLTGHLVCSTLHTNSAAETITRLIDMGLDPFTFGDALLGILAQRLARRICGKCKHEYPASGDEHEEIAGFYGKAELDKQLNGRPLTLWRSKGCSHCANSGYKGRIGVHELLINEDIVRHAIQHKATVAEIVTLAKKGGMRTLLQDGIDKCFQGHTDLKQVLAVCSR
ncbi:MAG: Flp pilus assembly complex ATPase component [Proteobacteria bacterium]|nr:Flp pilus assembly complex ATPase component [Pseudomonadota bacterium]